MKTKHQTMTPSSFIALLYQAYRPVLVRELKILSGGGLSSEEVDCLVDITFLSFFKSLMNGKFEYRDDPRTAAYLKKIIRFKYYKYHKARSKHEAAEQTYRSELEEELLPEGMDYTSPLRDPFSPDWIKRARQEDIRHLQLCLNELSDTDQEVLTRRYYDKEKVKQIAIAMEQSENWVKTRLFRARKKIERRMEQRRNNQ